MEFIKTFENNSDYVSYRDGKKYEIPNVSLSKDTKKVHYNLYANGHEYVDLGLPSGTLWATMNVGAKSSGETGLYFQWGDTSGYTADEVKGGVTDRSVAGIVTPAKVSKSMASTSPITKGGAGAGGITIPGGGEYGKLFSLDDYKWYLSGSGDTISFKKYTVTGAALDLEDDAAHANMKGDWHMPTPDQMQELIDNTTTAWKASNGVSGMTFTSKKDTSKSIFIPAAGYAMNGSINSSGSYGYIWSSMLSESSHGTCLYFFEGDVDMDGSKNRFNGFSVRGVIG